MKPEILDTLLIDRELGELASEAGELLDAYLAQSPPSAGRASELARTVEAARRAIAAPREETVPCFDLVAEDLRHLEMRKSRKRFGLGMLGLAAAVAFGIGLGWLRSPPRAADPSPVVNTTQDNTSRDDPPDRFWSRDRFVLSSAGLQPPSHGSNNRSRVWWESPFRKPRVEKIP